MGKIPHGIMEGGLHWIGAYDYCQETRVNYTYNASHVTEERDFRGQYARLDLSLYAVSAYCEHVYKEAMIHL